ncbi:hypothetical protein I3760_08G064600 [Carya illinoinensis]|nr:hypothetical protein I3760_08G064600 [Carya illinoinensis]
MLCDFDSRLIPYGFTKSNCTEIINTNGTKGMRVFNIYVQDEKVLSELDIFSVVGANKPLQLVDLRVSIKEME